MNQQPNVVGDLRNAAYQIDPVLWVREVLGVTPTAWRQTFLRAPRGASILALTARQVGKTTTAAWAIAHAMVFMPGSLSVIACPAQRQSAEAVRRIREILLKVGAKLVSDNVYALELENGSRVLAPPGTDDSIRGLTVDAWIVADEAARTSLPPCARCAPAARRHVWPCSRRRGAAPIRSGPRGPAMIRPGSDSTRRLIWIPAYFRPNTWSRNAWRLVNTLSSVNIFGIPVSGAASPFTWELYARVTDLRGPLMPPGPAFEPPPQPPPVPVPNPFRDPTLQGAVR